MAEMSFSYYCILNFIPGIEIAKVVFFSKYKIPGLFFYEDFQTWR